MATTLESRGLIPPNSKNLGQVGSVIDIVILFFTIVGALIILVGLIRKEFKTKTSTVRTRLLMMLVFSDLFMGVVGIISPLYYVITDGPGGPDGRFCAFLAFMLMASFWSQYFVAMILALSTYCILVHPLAHLTRLIQRWYLWFFPALWVLSFVFSGVAWHVGGFGFSAGFCYLGGGGPRFFTDMYAFIPRTIVLLVVVALYAHLFHFLRRPDKLHASSSSRTDELQSSEGHWWGKGRLGRRVGLERTRQGSTPMDSNDSAHDGGGGVGLPSMAEPTRHRNKSDAVPLNPKAPWEAINIDMPDIPDFAFEPPSRRESEMTAHSRAQPTTPPADFQAALEARFRPSPKGDKPESISINGGGGGPRSDFVSFNSNHSLTSNGSHHSSSAAVVGPPSPSASERSAFTVSTVDSLSAPPIKPAPKRTGSGILAPPSSSSAGAGAGPAATGSRKMSLKDILDADTSITLPARADGERDPTASQIRRTSEGVVMNEESLSSYMNRKASLLMILFPLAYVALFSVSLARIVVDFVIDRPVPWLSGLSRFLIFSQGIVDVVLYGIVEWRIRRGVQRKTQAGHFDSRGSSA